MTTVRKQNKQIKPQLNLWKTFQTYFKIQLVKATWTLAGSNSFGINGIESIYLCISLLDQVVNRMDDLRTESRESTECRVPIFHLLNYFIVSGLDFTL